MLQTGSSSKRFNGLKLFLLGGFIMSCTSAGDGISVPTESSVAAANSPDENLWMETGAEKLKLWLMGQNEKIAHQLRSSKAYQTLYSSIDARLSSVPATSDVAITPGGVYVQYRDVGAQKFSTLFVEFKSGKKVDVSEMVKLGENQSVAYFFPSPDDRFGIIGLMENGSEKADLRIIDLKQGRLLPDKIDLTQYQEITFRKSSQTFVYRRFDQMDHKDLTEKMMGMKIRAHTIGTDSKLDPVLVGEGIPANPPFNHNDYFFYSELTKSEIAIASAYKGTIAPHRLYYKNISDIGKPNMSWQQFVSDSEKVTEYAAGPGALYLLSGSNENLDQLEEVSFEKQGKPIRRLIYRNSDFNFDKVVTSSEGIYLLARKKLDLYLMFFAYGATQPMVFPQDKGVDIPTLAGSPHHDQVILKKATVDRPDELFQFSPKRGLAKIELNAVQDKVFPLEVRSFEAKTKDGAIIPYELVSRKSLVLDTNTPVLIRSYASYGNSYRPFYERAAIDWYARGGTVLYCYARGGGELGESWHRAAMKENKYRSIDDTIACAEDMIRRGFTKPAKLSFSSASAGGIIAGNLVVRRPDLFAAVISQNGVLELSKMQTATSTGSANIAEFGDITNPAEAASIKQLDPYLQIVPGKSYPATLCIHGFNDRRVPIWMSAKFCKRLQAAQGGKRPVLMKTEFNDGHGYGSDRRQRSERGAEIWTFLINELQVPDVVSPTQP